MSQDSSLCIVLWVGSRASSRVHRLTNFDGASSLRANLNMLLRCGCSNALSRLATLLQLKLFTCEAGRHLMDRVEGDLLLLNLILMTYLHMTWLLLRWYLRLKWDVFAARMALAHLLLFLGTFAIAVLENVREKALADLFCIVLYYFLVTLIQFYD